METTRDQERDGDPARLRLTLIRIIVILILQVAKRNQSVKTQRRPGLTRQRSLVLKLVRTPDEHPTATEVFERAKKEMPGISFATVYNSLRYLKAAGLIREIASFGKSPSRYDSVTDRHDHAICSLCGSLVDFDLPGTVALQRAAARASRFQPESVHLTLYGRCPKCRDKS